MFIFGHLGIGQALVRPWRSRLPWVPLALGMLLPDLLDKPLYYSRLSPFFCSTRTVGHTLLLVGLVCAIAAIARSRGLWALAAGMATHIVLDNTLDWLVEGPGGSAWIAATWPLQGVSFYRVTFTFAEHVGRIVTIPVLIAEIVGVVLLGWEIRRRVAAARRV